MSPIDTSLAALAAVVVVMAAIVYAVMAAAWRSMSDDGQTRIFQVLRRHGAGTDQPFATGRHDAVLAVRRCTFCSYKAECDQWLASGAKRGLEDFCPNAEFVARVAGPHQA
jgi:hypothetical protein